MEKRWGERNIGKYFRLRLDISLIVDSIFSRRYIYFPWVMKSYPKF